MAHFSFTITRDDEEIEVEGVARSTGRCNRDVGGGGSYELDDYELDTDLELTDLEQDAAAEAAQDALNDQ